MKVFLLFSFVYVSQALIVCPPDACATVRCAAVTAENCNGAIKQNGGFCGCCDSCENYLAEGDRCFTSILLGMPSTSHCGPGLHCDMHTFKCVATLNPCAQELSTFTATHGGMPLLGAHKPLCDVDGYYTPKQCQGSRCSCVSKEGKAIEGYGANVWEAQHMTCQCARDQYEYMQTGLIGRLFYCTSDGSYQNYQCTGDVCRCTDSNGDVIADSKAVHIGQIDSLRC
ncbi:nidogen-2-like isoform X2 [Ostrea edulis]|uniref:nidogen-2-like isoform X2 n=1 Tax=Ostrea edulis TaxID=37623 RepID=UPI0024AF6C16|nr:nidogen-2-like isoform X2 [Ostrea edulis]XP_055997365.1 nidogen-2-like isoform X2 [Ostrea edulis]